MSKDEKDFHFAAPRSAAEQGLLHRLMEMSRFSRYAPDEASDMAKSAVNGASQYMQAKSPEADFMIISSVPYSSGDGKIGSSVAQEIRAGRYFGATMRQDVIPQQARFFCDPGWTGFKQRLVICWRILFGGQAADGYGRKDP